MSQLRQHEQRFVELDVRVKIVTFDTDFLAIAYAKKSKLPWPLLLDSDKALYDAYGMQRGSAWNLYNPISIAKYLYLMLRGQMPGKPGSDFNQLGGDVLIDPQGVVRMHHVSNSPHDRPSIESIFEVIQKENHA